MNVTMSGQWPHTILVTNSNSFAAGDLADATQSDFREALLPGVQKWHGVAAGYRKEQFEVFAIGQRGEQRRFGGGFGFGVQPGLAGDGNCRCKQLCAHVAGFEDVPQIPGKAITDIDHGVNREMPAEPMGLRQARLELKMPPRQRATEFTGDEDRVSRLRARTKDDLLTI